ncbi:hypothetical protein O4216_01085 [Rhodococcus erythropolis]|nr:hypothetical protein [Rhodococcus erythropolis]
MSIERAFGSCCERLSTRVFQSGQEIQTIITAEILCSLVAVYIPQDVQELVDLALRGSNSWFYARNHSLEPVGRQVKHTTEALAQRGLP